MSRQCQYRIDNTIVHCAVEQVLIYRAGCDIGHILKMDPQFYKPGTYRTVSPVFHWPQRIHEPQYSPHVPDAIIPVPEMLDLQPVPLQVSQLHHFWVDHIPWPGVRINILCALDLLVGQIDEFDIGYDYLNSSTRFHGGLPWDARNYEISEIFYLKWGWLFDKYVIETTDYLRKKRGLRSIRTIGRVGSVQMTGVQGKRKLVVDDLSAWGGESTQHLVRVIPLEDEEKERRDG